MLLASGSIITIESKMGDGYYSEASASRVLAAIMWAKSSGERIFFNWKKCTVNGKDTYTLTQFSILR